MIPTTKDRTITIGGIDNATQFSIATSGKAFRTLIDNLYSDKVQAPVRELITNAVDAHVAAGNDAPFKVIVPTTMDPTFGVRDYGTGMDHELVVGLYTTLFASSKDTSNEQTGMLGLGSKSPFAYTDSFTVEAFDGVSKRIYMAYIENDVPSLSLVGNVPSTEPRGICVKFPVQTAHVHSFDEAIYSVLRGLDTLPELDGADLDEGRLPKVIAEGQGWRLVQGIKAPLVRQGGVLYPLRSDVFRDGGFPSSGYRDAGSYVFDVPIGTADVTPSREALSYDEATIARLTAHVAAAWKDLVKQIKAGYAACTSQLEHMEWLQTVPESLRDSHELRQQFDPEVMRGRFDLFPAHFKKAATLTQADMAWVHAHPELFPQDVKYQRPTTYIDYQSVPNLRIVLDDGVSPRRRSRMLDWAGGNMRSRLYLPAGPQQAGVVKRLKALMGLSDEHFTPVAEIYDPGPRITARTVTKKDELLEAVASGKPWCERYRTTFRLRDENGAMIYEGRMDEFHYSTGFDADNVVFFTELQVEKLTLDFKKSLSAALMSRADGYVDAFTKDYNVYTVRSALEEAKCTHPVELTQHLGYVPMRHVTLSNAVRQLAYRNIDRYSDDKVAALVAEAKVRYPALFPTVLDNEELGNYLQQQDTNRTTTTTNDTEVSS
jgi:hypothetical protein